MKSKNNTSIYIIIAIVFSLLYLFLAAKPLAKEYHYNPVWKINTSNPVISENTTAETSYFKLGQTLGYFTEDGDITLYKSYPSHSAISSDYYAVYNSQDKAIPFYNNQNQQAGILQAEGYPYFSEDRIYVFLPGGASFVKAKSDGTTSWIKENTIPITAFASKPNFTAAGYADGKIRVFENTDGTNILTFAPGGSDFPVILGLDISSNGKLIASVSGHDRQRFVLAQKEETQTKILYHNFLKTDTNYRTLVHLCEDTSRVFYVYKDFIGIYDYVNDKNYNIPIKGQILSLRENDNLVILLGKEGRNYTVYFVEKTNSLEGTFTFEAETAFITTINNNLYIGKDNTISKINITKE